jgi:hypothetical protein
MHSVSLVQDIGEALSEHPSIKYRANSALHTRNMEELLACVSDFMSEVGLPATLSVNEINTYFNLMTQNRAFGLHGTTPGNGTLWLCMLMRALNPKVVVESGVYHGSSLFTIKASAPQAKVFAFDVNFANLLFRLDGVDYREHDWAADDIRAEGPSDMCFFDDHINNCMRVRQAYDRGFRHVVVDDSPDLGEIHNFRYPAVPSMSMIENDKWADGDTVMWNWKGRRLRYTFRTSDTYGVKDIIESLHRFPSIKRWTGMEDAYHYYIRLKFPD